MGNKNFTILAIDDIHDNLISLKALIRESFSDVLIYTASSGAKGLEIAAEKDPDVILLDIVMPEMDGFEVCKRLKADPTLIDIPVVFITALKGDKDSRIYALECGAEAFLAKPIDPSELTAQIRAMVKIKIAKIEKRDEKERLTRMVEEQTRDLRASELAAKNLLYSLRKEIEQKKKNDEILKKSEENYKNLVEHSPNIIYRYSNTKGGIFWSDRVKDILGFTQSDLLNDPFLWNNSIYPDDKNIVQNAIEACYNDGDFNVEYRIKTKDGRWIWLNDILMHKYSVGDEIIIEGIATDITARKQAEEALQNALMRYQIFFEHTGSSNSIFDTNCCLILQNKESIAQFGLSPDDAIGKSVYELFEPQTGEKVYRRMKQVLETGKSETYNTQFNLQTGNKWFTTSYQALHDEYNKVIGVQIISYDITENKQREVLQSLSSDIIDILNSEKDTTEILSEILSEIKRVTKFSAMGIRFKIGEDYPYVTTLGFADEFLHKENSLHVTNTKHDICRDINGQPMLGCICGMVISGKYNASETPLTKYGTFWTNNSYPLLDLSIDDEPRFHPRNTCIHEGYGSLAIIPIRSKNSVVGTLQLNEKRTNAFTEEMIHFFEAICLNIGNTLMRKQAQKKLEQSEEKFTKLFKSSPDAILLTRLSDGTLVDFNDVVCSISGYEREELLGQSMQSLNLWADISVRNIYIENLVKNRHISNYEIKVRLKSGEVRIGLLSAEIISLDGEEFTLAVIRDISDRKRAEILLNESRAKFAAVFDYAPVIISITDLNTGQYIDVNEYACFVSEYSKEEIIGTTATQLEWINKQNRKLLLETLQNDGRIRDLELQFNSKTGREIFGIVNGQIITIDNKECLLTITVDITERKKTEEAFTNQKYFYEQMFMQSSISTQILDSEGWCVRINPKLTELFGVEPQHIEGKVYNIFEDASIKKGGIDRFLNKAYKEGKPSEWEVFFDIGQAADSQNIKINDRRIEWFYNWAYPIFDNTGEICNVIIQHQKITERKKLEEHVKKEQANLLAIVENSRNGMWSVNNEFCLIRSNQAFNNYAKELWDVEICDGISMLSFLPIDEIIEYNELYSLALSGESVSAIKNAFILNQNFYYEMTFNPIKVECDIIGISCRLQDITQRIIDEQTILRRTQELRLLIDSSLDYIFSIDKVYRIVTCNKSFRGGVNTIIGRPPLISESILFPEMGKDTKEQWQEVFDRVLDGESMNFESEPKWFNAKTIILNSDLNPIYDMQGNVIGLVGVVRDITQSKLVERRILNATIEAEERERNHFARELHEGLGPILSVIKLYFQWINKPNIHTSKETLMENIQAAIADAIATTKEISYKLSPHVLENFGIGNAVSGFIEKITAHNTLHFRFECTLANRIEKDIEISIYRLITECINNTVKYANAQNVAISLTLENEILYFSYSDDGIGFDPEKRKEQTSGLGLLNMQNRITMLGGTFIIRTGIGKGFSVFVDLPAKYIIQNE